ncbi:MAG: hypothetical protein Q8T04_17230 [Bacteroidota bacterium]|nr:hypothetical protein [Bacteroidota bacterium]
MRKAELHIEKLKETFEDKDHFQIADLYAFYQSIDSTIAKSTINWRINSLVKVGTIQRIGRGTYKFGSTNSFIPQVSMRMFRISNLMKSNFPYLKYIIWHISEINFFSQHLINKDVCYVEVEREAVDAVFELLREKYKYVLKGKFNDDVYFGESIIVVRNLVSGFPAQLVQNVPTTTIEKLLVDLFSDKEFEFLQGNELSYIFNNAFSKYTINVDKLLRYASRKEKRNTLVSYINTIK